MAEPKIKPRASMDTIASQRIREELAEILSMSSRNSLTSAKTGQISLKRIPSFGKS